MRAAAHHYALSSLRYGVEHGTSALSYVPAKKMLRLYHQDGKKIQLTSSMKYETKQQLLISLFLIAAFFLGSMAFGMGDEFLILRGYKEIIGSILLTIFLSALVVIPVSIILKVIQRQSHGINQTIMVWSITVGALLAPIPMVLQEYLFIRNAQHLSQSATFSADIEQERWWPCRGYTLRGIMKSPGEWRFFVME